MDDNKVIVCPKFPLKKEHAESYSNCILVLLPDEQVDNIKAMDFIKSFDAETEVVNEIVYKFESQTMAEQFNITLTIKIRQNEDPILNTIQTTKTEKKHKGLGDVETDSMVVVDQSSIATNDDNSPYHSQDLIRTDINKIDKKYHHFFHINEDNTAIKSPPVLAVRPREAPKTPEKPIISNVVLPLFTANQTEEVNTDNENEEPAVEKTIIKAVVRVNQAIQEEDSDMTEIASNKSETNNNNAVDELTLSSKDEPFLKVLMKSSQLKNLFIQTLSKKFQIVSTRAIVEVDKQENDISMQLTIKYKNTNENSIKNFIKNIKDYLINENKTKLDNSVEVEFNRRINIDEDLEMLMIYLEIPERTNGGDIMKGEKVLNERFINFKFEQFETKLKFLSQKLNEIRSHKLFDYKIMNVNEPFSKLSFEIDKRCVIIRNLINKDDLFIELFAENLQKNNDISTVVKSNLFQNTYFAEYEADYKENELDYRLERRKRKLKDQVYVLKSYLTNTLIVYLNNTILNKNEENIEKLLKTHFCDDYEEFLQTRKFNNNVYLIRFPTLNLLNESLRNDKSVFLDDKIVFEKLYNFDLLDELNGVNDAVLINANKNPIVKNVDIKKTASQSTINDFKIQNSPATRAVMIDNDVAINENIKYLIVDADNDPLIKVFYHLHEKYLNELKKKFENSYKIKINPESHYKLRFTYDSKERTEEKVLKLIRTYTEINFKLEMIHNIAYNEVNTNFKFNTDNVYISSKDNNEIEIIGYPDDVENLSKEIKEYLKKKEEEVKQLLKDCFIVDDLFDPLIKILFLLHESHLISFKRKFFTYGARDISLQEPYKVKLSFDDKKTDQEKLKRLIHTYLGLSYKIETIKSITKEEITGNFNYKKNDVYFSNKNNNEVEILGTIDEVENLVSQIDKKFNEIIPDETVELAAYEARMLIFNNFKAQYENEFQNVQISFQLIPNKPNAYVKITGTRKNIDEIKNKMQILLKTMHRIKLENITNNEQFKFLSKNESLLHKLMQQNNIKCTFDFDHYETALYGFLSDKQQINQVQSLINENILKPNRLDASNNTLEENLDANELPVYKLLIYQDNIFREFKRECDSFDATIDVYGDDKIKITYEPKNEANIKNLLTKFEKNHKVVNISTSLDSEINDFLSGKQVICERSGKSNLRLIGFVKDVDGIVDHIKKSEVKNSFTLPVSAFRFLHISKFKSEIENTHPTLKIVTDKVLNTPDKLIMKFENADYNVAHEAKANAEKIVNSLIKIPLYFSKNIVTALKKADTDLFKLMQQNDIKCTLEFNEETGVVHANMLDREITDKVQKFLDDYIKKNLQSQIGGVQQPSETASGETNQKRQINLELFQYRILIVNRLERVVKKKWPNIAFNLAKGKQPKIEIEGTEEAVEDSIKMVKNILDNIISEEFPYEKIQIDILKAKEADLIRHLSELRINCVVEFLIEKGSIKIYATNRESIKKCKDSINEFGKKV